MFTTTASSFCIPTIAFTLAAFLLVPSSRAGAQMHVEVHAGGIMSSTVAEDQLATPILRARFGNQLDESVTAHFTPGPAIGVGLEIPLKVGTLVTVTGTWSGTKLRIEDSSGSRDAQTVSVIEGIFGMRHTFRRVIEAGGGVGVAHFGGEDRGLFRGGAPVAPVARGDVGTGWNVGAHRAHLRAVLQLNRFDTNAITDAGGRAGNVMRFGAEASLTWKGAVTR